MLQDVLFIPQKQETRSPKIDIKQQENIKTTIKRKEKELEGLRIDYHENQNKLGKEFFIKNPDIQVRTIKGLTFGAEYNKQQNLEANLARGFICCSIKHKSKRALPNHI